MPLTFLWLLSVSFSFRIAAFGGVFLHQIRERQVIPVEDHLFSKGGAEFALGVSEFGFAAEIVQFAGIGVEVVEFVDGTWRGEVGGALAG